MKIKKVADEMIDNAGGNWVLERTLVVDNVVKYCRICDCMFTFSSLPLQYILDEQPDDFIEDYWEVGACTAHITIDVITELIDRDLLTTFQSMQAAWKADPKWLGRQHTEDVKTVIADMKEAKEPLLILMIKEMAAAKQCIDDTIWDEDNDEPTIEDLQIVVAGKTFNIGSYYTDVVSLVYDCLNDVQKFAANEIL